MTSLSGLTTAFFGRTAEKILPDGAREIPDPARLRPPPAQQRIPFAAAHASAALHGLLLRCPDNRQECTQIQTANINAEFQGA